MSNSTIQLSCHVLQKEIHMQEGFDEDFCRALAAYLEDGLDAGFYLVSGDEWGKDGKAVEVDVRVESKDGARVTIASGYVNSGVFTKKSSVEMSLFSSDAPLSPSSSKALVREIGKQFGIIR